MKKNIIEWIIGCAGCLALISCSQNEENMQPHSKNDIRFSASITSPATRVTEQAFESGDNISVFAFIDDQGFAADAYATNVKYSYSNGTFQPATEEGIAYPAEGGLAFWAIYPYCEQAASTFNFGVAEDQSTATAYGDSDLMTASTSLTMEQSPVLSFYHRLACVKIKCTFEAAEEQVISITVNNVQKNVSTNLSNNTYEGIGDRASGLSPYPNDDGSYKIILPPQAIATGTSFMVIQTTSGNEYTWKVPRELQLASGCRYTYNLKVAAGGEIVFTSSINPWHQEEEKIIKKRVKQIIWEEWTGETLDHGFTYNYKYDEQGRPIEIGGPSISGNFHNTTISYSENTITFEYKSDPIEDYPDTIIYTLDNNGLVTKISNNFRSGMTLSYTNGYLTKIVNDEGYQYTFEWSNGKMAKKWEDSGREEKDLSELSYTSTANYKLPFSICELIIGYHPGSSIGVGSMLPVPNTYFGKGMEYLPTTRTEINFGKTPYTVNYSYETDADGYVTKLIEDSGDYRTTYTTTYEEIE